MTGRVWKFGDHIDTDLLAPGAYMKGSVAELARHCLEAVDANFASSVRPGDVVVAGSHFGMGSSREQAVEALRILGIKAVIAPTFAGIFYRNAFNLGLPAVVCPESDRIEAGDRLEVDFRGGSIRIPARGLVLSCEPLPQHLLDIVEAGGLMPWLQTKLGTRP